jgi:hypothetical protein
MTKNLLQIVPYIATHGKIILANQMNHVLMDKDAQYEGDAMQLEQKIGLKFASWLGLQNEGLMKHYGFDGSDHFRYARIF